MSKHFRHRSLDIPWGRTYAGSVMPQGFPFSAIVGQQDLKSALVLNAVDPLIGGVLIRGEKGTAKTTTARGVAALLPPIPAVAGCPYHCDPVDPDKMDLRCRERVDAGERLSVENIRVPFVEVPLNATEDRLVGTLSIEKALSSGNVTFSPGLLAEANRGLLYVDEVNLFPDHLVDMLLDAASSGVNRVERDGVSVEHPSRFVLIGTMNPEEGELRPQFLDRFGLCVDVKGLVDPSDRKKVIERRLGFDRKADRQTALWNRQDAAVAARILKARLRLPSIRIPASLLELIVSIATRAGVKGHRADITLARTSCAFAALLQRTWVTRAMVMEAARFVLPHRIETGETRPYSGNGSEVDKMVEGIARDSTEGRAEWHEEGSDDFEEADGTLTEVEVPGSTAAGTLLLPILGQKKKNPKGLTGKGLRNTPKR